MTVLTGWFKNWVLKTRCLRRENHELQNSFWEMKVMLTPPDLWGDTGGPGAAQTMYQVQDVTLSALLVFPPPDNLASGETQLWGWWPSVGRRQGDSSREHHPHQQAETGQGWLLTTLLHFNPVCQVKFVGTCMWSTGPFSFSQSIKLQQLYLILLIIILCFLLNIPQRVFNPYSNSFGFNSELNYERPEIRGNHL